MKWSKRLENIVVGNQKKSIPLYIILLTSLFVTPHCAMDVPENGYEYLAPPVIHSCEQSGNKIEVTFRGYNNEYYFDGYNVYVSSGSMNRDSVASYKSVQIEDCASCMPSFPLSPDEYNHDNPGEPRSIILYHYYLEIDGEYVPFQFEGNTTYYIFLCSHHRVVDVLPEGVSNQVSITFDPINQENKGVNE